MLVQQEALPGLSDSLSVLAENVFGIQRQRLLIAEFIPVILFVRELVCTYITMCVSVCLFLKEKMYCMFVMLIPKTKYCKPCTSSLANDTPGEYL